MLLLLLACTGEDADSSLPPPDLVAPLGPDEVRAGVVTDPAALFGGVSAEGRLGDVLLVNDRVRFVVQQVGDSSYYLEHGGAIVDADVVRPAGEPGRDLVDELAVMVGFGLVCAATSVEVVAEGRDGEAVVRVEGPAAPLTLATGALESPGLIAARDLWITTEYRLAPGSWHLVATTTVENRDGEELPLAVGDVGLVSLDVGEIYAPRTGLAEPDGEPMDWIAVLGRRNEVALALLAATDALETGPVGSLLTSLAQSVSGFGPTETVPDGASITWTRHIGVAPDLAALTGARDRARGPTQALSGVVTDGAAPVPGARVHVLDAGGEPLTVAFADQEGAWSATVPAGPVSVVPTGRGSGLVVDLPAGAGTLSPYEADPTVTLASIAAGADGPAFAEGHGQGAAVQWPAPATLPARGTLAVRVADGGPAVVRVAFAAGDPAAVDGRLVPGRPSGHAALGWVRDGALDVPVEPGTYVVTVHRGARDEQHVETVTVAPGGTATVEADVPRAFEVAGVQVIDPHSHASPSSDGGIPMEERLLVTAANGIDIHVGTDHDHVADYRPLLEPLGLAGRLRSVVAAEVSPVLRGHFNTWPTEVAPGANGGAYRWWLGYEDTAEIFAWMRAAVGTEGVIQLNHPIGSSGMLGHAGYDPVAGTVASAAHWSEDFDAMEVVNSGDWAEYFPSFVDLARRGHPVVPVGVSDSHGHTSGQVGLAVTWLHTGLPLDEVDDDALRAAMARGATVASLGPLVEARVDGAWAPGGTFAGVPTLEVTVWAPSWMPVETVSLWRDGAVVATEPCVGAAPSWCAASWPLEATDDASWVVTAQSATRPMTGAWAGTLAFATTAAMRTDLAGDGWEAPLPRWTVEGR